MPIKPVLRDDNGLALADCGSETITQRYASVDTTGQAILLPVDVKKCIVHIEGSVEVARVTGTAGGSVAARLTSDGLTIDNISVVQEANATLMTVAAPSGTINVSVIGWR